jgi:hypothetical protein
MGGCCSCCADDVARPEFIIKKPTIGTILSDIDNTLIHHEDRLIEMGYERIHERKQIVTQVEPSSTSPNTEQQQVDEEFINSDQEEDDEQDLPQEKKSEESKNKTLKIHRWRHRITDTHIETYSLPFKEIAIAEGSYKRKSANQQRAFISLKTLKLIQSLRKDHGVKLCLFSDYDYLTFQSRCLNQQGEKFPEFDFAVCEGGAKLFQNSNGVTTMTMRMDENWFKKFAPVFRNSNSNSNNDETVHYYNKYPLAAPEDRQGVLWDCYRRLANKKASAKVNLGENVIIVKLDATLYETAFVVEMGISENPNDPSSSTSLSASKQNLNLSNIIPNDNQQQQEVEEDDEEDSNKLKLFEGEIKLRQFVQTEFPGQLSVSISEKGRKAIITPKGCTKAELLEEFMRQILALRNAFNKSSSVEDDEKEYERMLLRAIDHESSLSSKELAETEAILAQREKELSELMILLEEGRQKVIQLQSDNKYWRNAMKEDAELIEMEVNELDRVKADLLQPYQQAKRNLLQNLESLQELIDLRKKMLQQGGDAAAIDDLPEQLLDILEGSRMLLTSKDELLADDAQHNMRMSKRTWGGFLAFLDALTSEEFADEIQNFSPENIPGYMQEKIFRMTDETPSFRLSEIEGKSFSAAAILAKWVNACVEYFPKEESQVFPARKKIKKKQKENRQRQEKSDKNMQEIEEIEATLKDGMKGKYFPLRNEVKRLKLFVEHLKLKVKELEEKRNKILGVLTDDRNSPREGNTSASSHVKNPLSANNVGQNSSSGTSRSVADSNDNKNHPHQQKPPKQQLLNAALFDDQDDLDFVKFCDLGYAPVISHPLVKQFLERSENRDKFCPCPHEGFLGTEYALQKLLKICEDSAK